MAGASDEPIITKKGTSGDVGTASCHLSPPDARLQPTSQPEPTTPTRLPLHTGCLTGSTWLWVCQKYTAIGGVSVLALVVCSPRCGYHDWKNARTAGLNAELFLDPASQACLLGLTPYPPSTNEIPLTHRHCCGLPLLLLSHQAWASYRGLGDPTASLWCSFGTPVLLSLPTIIFCDKVVHIQCTCRRGDSGVDSLCTYIQGSCRRCHT